MKKLLIFSFVLEIIGAVVSFFLLLFSNFLYAIIALPFMILGIVPLFALIQNIDDIEDLQYKVSRLNSKIKSLESNDIEPKHSESFKNVDIPKSKELSREAWVCAKCGNVNKENTNRCSNCNTDYSFNNTVYEQKPKKKKVSRWVKF